VAEWGMAGGVQKLQKYFFSKFSKIVIIPKKHNIGKIYFYKRGVARGRGCGRGGKAGGVQKIQKYFFFQFFKKSS